MQNKPVHTEGIVNTLDKTLEMKTLERDVAALELNLRVVSTQLEDLTNTVTAFQKMYERRVGRLYQILDALEEEIFKYQHIGENVDSHFSFKEAEQVFNETMKSRRAHLDDEYAKLNRKRTALDNRRSMSDDARNELKLIYRRLAHLFHPDMSGGDVKMMIRINSAYCSGDLETLRELDTKYSPIESDAATCDGLKKRLSDLRRLIKTAEVEIREIRHSDWHVMMTTFMSSADKKGPYIENIIRKIKKDITRRERQLTFLKEKFNPEVITPISL